MTATGSSLPGPLRLPPSLPFVGRADELAVLGALWSQATSDGRRIAILQGDAGTGKTRLARAIAEAAAEAGARVLYGACDPPPAPPYQAVEEALEQLADHEPEVVHEVMSGPRGTALAALLPDVAGVAPAGPEQRPDHSGGRFRVHAAISDVLCEAARRRPVLLVVDDLHWADAPTLLLLRNLARTTADARLLVLATTREVEAEEAPDLADTLAELWRTDGVARVQLGGLREEDIVELLRRLAPDKTSARPEALAGPLAEMTGGNAFLVAELGQHLAEAGLLDDDAGKGPVSTFDAVGVPQGVREMIGQRMARMSPAARDVLELAATGPRGIELGVLREAATVDEATLLGTLDEAIASRMLEEIPGTALAYRLRHELLRRAVLDRLPASRRAALHLRVGEGIEAVHGHNADRVVSDLALHFGQAADLGGRERAVRYGLRAAELAARSFAYADAARRLQAAMELGIVDPAQRGRALCDLGLALHRTARVPEALESYAASAEVARAAGDAPLLAHAAIGFENACWRPGISDAGALRLIEDAEAALGDADDPLRARLHAARSRALAYQGQHGQAASAWREAVDMARRVGDSRSLAISLFHATWTRGARSSADVLASLDEACDLFAALGDDDNRHEVNGFRLGLLLEGFDTAALRRELPVVREAAERTGQPFYRHVTAYIGSTLAVCDGRLDEAAELAELAFELSRQFDEDASAVHGIQMFTLQRERGRLAAVAPIMRLVAGRRWAEDNAWGPALALLLAELGRLDEARRELRRLSADSLAGVQRRGLWLGGLVYLAETCALVEEPEVAAILYPELRRLEGTNLVIGHAVACYGAADRHLGMLAATMGDLDAAERHFEAALALNAAMESPTWTAHTQHAYARMLRRRGAPGDLLRAGALQDAALTTARRAGLVALAARLEAEHAPEEALGLPDGLSAREVEVLRLVAGGRSNRDIGTSLHISQHTAANHVRSILAKTGCANRTEAAAYAYRSGLMTR